MFHASATRILQIFHKSSARVYGYSGIKSVNYNFYTLTTVLNSSELIHLRLKLTKPIAPTSLSIQKENIHLSNFCSTNTLIMADSKYVADYDKRGQASCKKCKQKIGKGLIRIAKVVPNFFHDGEGEMKQYYHPKCIMETFVRARATTKIIEDHTDVEGFQELQDEDKESIKELIKELMEKKGAKKTPKKTPKKTTPKATAKNNTQTALSFSPGKIKVESQASSSPKKEIDDFNGPSTSAAAETITVSSGKNCKDNSFRQYRRLAADIAEESSYLEKTKIISTFLSKGSSGTGFEGDLYLILKLLLPGVVKLVYNINSKQLVKVFSQIFATSLDKMVEDLEQGDVAETVKVFFEQSKVCQAQTKSTLTIHEVDALLTELSQFTKEDDQQRVLTKMARRSTSNDLKMIVRLIKHDIRINSGAKHVLEGLDPHAYEAFQASRNLHDVVDRVLELRKEHGDKPGMGKKKLSIRASVMTPVLPMLAEACKSVEMAFKKCPNGMYSEIKYDGERVQVHKKGHDFNFFSRSLKPVLPHKVNHFKEWIPKAFPSGSDLILDSEVLLVDTKTSKPLPFGTLGKHKKEQFSDANVCLFIFDCLNYNGTSLMDRPIKERRKFMYENMKEIPNRIMFSEMKHITKASDLKDMMADAFNEGLEGLVLKDVNSLYEPGKRHWLKVKKDYLAEGAMADSADLLVLGGYFGTGNKGGIMSIFLMGCYDSGTKKFVTVTKCGSGFDDKTLERLQKDLEPNMTKISKDYTKVPDWLNINRGVVPDYIVKDPKASPVWEISGAEFSKAEIHTAAGLSIRFPRCTKMRDDKTWKEATDLERLKVLVRTSKEKSDFGELLGASSKSKSTIPDITPPDTDSDSNMGGNENNGALKMEVEDIRTASSSSTPQKKNTPNKRKSLADKDDSGSSPFKKQKEDKVKKPMCKYGAACYQKNPDHQRKFSHSAASYETSDSKGLPDIFRGMKFYLSDGIPDAKKLKRYIIAYDGDIVADYDKETAIQVVDIQNEENKDDSVTADWLKKCIKQKKVLPHQYQKNLH